MNVITTVKDLFCNNETNDCVINEHYPESLVEKDGKYIFNVFINKNLG